MDDQLQQALVELNNSFYKTNALSFSATRASAWDGWQRVAELIKGNCLGEALDVIDVGAGNMRFERYLIEALPAKHISFFMTDNCPALVPTDLPQANSIYLERDVISALLAGTDPLIDVDPRDIACCFGLMHHIPGASERAALLKSLIAHVRTGGLAIVSLWRFMEVPALAAKAQTTLDVAANDEALPVTLRAQLGSLAAQGDYLLGWQDSGTYRYCHSFNDDDVTGLVDALSSEAVLLERFRADGKSGNANEYLVFKKVS